MLNNFFKLRTIDDEIDDNLVLDEEDGEMEVE